MHEKVKQEYINMRNPSKAIIYDNNISNLEKWKRLDQEFKSGKTLYSPCEIKGCLNRSYELGNCGYKYCLEHMSKESLKESIDSYKEFVSVFGNKYG